MAEVYRRRCELPPGFSEQNLRKMSYSTEILMCPPDFFNVIDVKNPYMEGQMGQVNRDWAIQQWETLKTCFQKNGLKVHTISPLKDREDMVFCANQTFPGVNLRGEKICLLSHMKHPSRQAEVPAFAQWFSLHGYQVQSIPQKTIGFEGCGDALWHPGRALVWGGYGQRSDLQVYYFLSDLFQVPVLTLQLKTDRFYHLDTCFCPLDEKTALVYPPSLAPESVELIQIIFKDVIEVDAHEAMDLMACNAAAFQGRIVILQKGSTQTVQALRKRKFEVFEVETSEYMKSGGSVFCMKMALF